MISSFDYRCDQPTIHRYRDTNIGITEIAASCLFEIPVHLRYGDKRSSSSFDNHIID